MSHVAKAWSFTLLAAAGAALAFAVPAAGVALSFVGMLLSAFTAADLNAPATRAAAHVSQLLNAAAVLIATGSPLLALAAPAPVMPLLPTELVLRRGSSLHATLILAGLAAWLVLLAGAWSAGWWILASVPNGLFGAFIGLSYIKSLRDGRNQRASLQVGQALPELSLPYRDGSGEVSLSSLRGQYLLLVFLRGDWCPACHVMMRLINKQAAALERRGVRLLLVTPSEGPIDDEFATHLAIETKMLLDRGAAAAGKLGLLDPEKRDGQDVPLPVGLLIDPQGVVRDITRPDDVGTYADARKLEAALAAA